MNQPASSPTIADFLAASVAQRGTERALGYIGNGDLHWFTWQQVADAATQLAAMLRITGIAPGDRVAQVSENRYEWITTDLAIHLADAVHVPMHVTLSGEQIAAQIVDCGARLIIASTPEMAAKFAPHLPRESPILYHTTTTARLNRAARQDSPAASGPRPSTLDPRPSPLATILYTSGTTGRPRGVMLSHENLASNAAAMVESFGPVTDETRLCILPLSHIYARTCDLYTWLYRGSRLVLGESRETLARDLGLAQPTALNAVPFLYQRIADQIRAAGGDESAALHKFFGGHIEMLHCGGAPLAPEIEQWYADRGLPVLLGYGLTETSPVIAASTPRATARAPLARPLANLELRIADDGEIVVRGPSIMLGYWQDEPATTEILRDGWLHTGDLGELSADGFLTIRGRKKELIVLSTGKKVVPTRVELLLTASPLIEQAAVFGEGQPGLVALIVPTARRSAPSSRPRGGLAAVGEERGAGSENQTELNDCYATEIKRCLAHAAREEQIHRFRLLDRPFSIDQGELTAKLSLCREVIARNFAAELTCLAPHAKNSRGARRAGPRLPHILHNRHLRFQSSGQL